MNATASPPLTDAPERIVQLIWALCLTVSKRCGPPVFALSAAQARYVIDRVLAARKRFARIVARIRAGKPPKERARKPRKPRPAKPRRATLAEMEREFGAELPRGWRRRAGAGGRAGGERGGEGGQAGADLAGAAHAPAGVDLRSGPDGLLIPRQRG